MLNELYNKIKEQDRFSDVFKPISREEMKKRDREKIEDKLKEGKCTLNTDGSYSCEGNVDISDMGLTKIPVRFKEVKGGFYCSNNLETLDGAPEKVGGHFYCYYNKLETLEGGPKIVGGHFGCSNNNLETLEGAPEKVGGDFSCSNNKLETLEGAPKKVGRNFYCYYNKLETLEGAPESVGGGFYFKGNPIAGKLGIGAIPGSDLDKYR